MQEKNERRTNAARSEATRAALLAAARSKFIEKGYAETSTPEIVRAAEITRGALYHHFKDKADLFRAVLHAEYTAVAAEIDEATAGDVTDPVAALRSGARAYMDAMQSPGRVSLMLRDGPAVLDRAILDQIDAETSTNTLRLGLQAGMEAGVLRPLPLEPLTAQLSALFDRAALAVAAGERTEAHLQVIDAILDALRRP